MKELLLNFIKEHKLFSSKDKLLLTVSGGIDSMTMLNLFGDCDFNFAIAHCNFNLRGEESDGDEEFITRKAQELGIPIHINKFDTLKFAEEKKLSIQMAARELRYSWFERLVKENDYSKIVTAHNADDVAETFFINLIRGAGIHGLTGIKLVNGNIVRPLLFASRKDIEAYSKVKNVEFREDSSNADTKYLRNAIRHEIIPQFESLNPSFLKSLSHTTSILKEAEVSFNRHIDELRALTLIKNDNITQVDIAALQSHRITPALLFELLKTYGFSFDSVTRMLKNISNQPGAVYFSKTHKMVKDRTKYIIYPLEEKEQEVYTINESQNFFEGDINLHIKRLTADKDFALKRNKEVGTFDASKLKFPLTLRRWQQGDYFYPFGMRGKKKVSDYFIDQKVSIPEKENTWILCSGSDIIWIVNHRTDNRFCITNSTEEIIQIELKN